MLEPLYYIEITRENNTSDIIMITDESKLKIHGYIVYSESTPSRIGEPWSSFKSKISNDPRKYDFTKTWGFD